VLLLLFPLLNDRLIIPLANIFPTNAISVWVVAWWWLVLIFALLIYQIFFTLYPLFARFPRNLIARVAWAAANFCASPYTVPLYLWFCTDRLRVRSAREKPLTGRV